MQDQAAKDEIRKCAFSADPGVFEDLSRDAINGLHRGLFRCE